MVGREFCLFRVQAPDPPQIGGHHLQKERDDRRRDLPTPLQDNPTNQNKPSLNERWRMPLLDTPPWVLRNLL